MKKSSLKTFLNGENFPIATRLNGSRYLSEVVQNPADVESESLQCAFGETEYWIDVFDDGTAISYCPYE